MALVQFPSPPQNDDPELWTPPDDEEGGSGKMSFLEHLDELRKRIINALISLAVAVGVTFFFNKQIYDFIMLPLAKLLPAGGTLIFTEPTEGFMLRLKMSLLAGVILAAPLIMWQVWLFIAPGLYEKEKKFAVPFIMMSSIGFVAGAAFAHYVLFPFMWTFFASFTDEITKFTPKIDSTFALYTKMLLGMGLVFQMPSVVFFLAKLGLVTWRFLWRNVKYAILIIFIVAAVVTPDGSMVNQAVMAAPMIVLYFLSILIAAVFGKKKRSKDDSD